MNKKKFIGFLKRFLFSKKQLAKRIIPNLFLEFYRDFRITKWYRNHSLSPFRTPTFVKQKILLNHSINNALWIESGTYIGDTTGFLARNFPNVHTIEPSNECLKIAKRNLTRLKNIYFHDGTSEERLNDILKNLSGNVCFWLDGHFSDGITFCGKNHCPLFDELDIISKNISRFEKIVIFIDDVSAGFTLKESYPDINFYVDWAKKNNFNWNIEQGIFILKSKNLIMY